MAVRRPSDRDVEDENLRPEHLSDFNRYRQQDHPDMREGEEWFMNVHPDELDGFGWDTKRVGRTAYDSMNRVLPDLVPLFVQSWELELRALKREADDLEERADALEGDAEPP